MVRIEYRYAQNLIEASMVTQFKHILLPQLTEMRLGHKFS